MVPDSPEFVPLVNVYISVALEQLEKITVAVPTCTVACPVGAAVSKMPPVV
jgi:hypothetical protein